MRLTKNQQEAIVGATEKNDFCLISNHRTMNSLIDKGLALPTSGFGYQFGAIVELTDLGKLEREKIIKRKNL
jgi:hypothetical protein